MEQDLKVTIYSANVSNNSNVLFTARKMIVDLFCSHDLAYRLAKRDLSAQYRQSILGYLWAFLVPLVNTLTWLFLQKSGMVVIRDIGIPYTVYVFSGTMLWQIFVEALQSPIQQVVAAKGMLSKLNFPRESIVLSGIYKTLFNAIIKIVILIPLVIYFGAQPNWTILMFPLAVISIVLVGTAIGLLLSPVGTLYSDVGRVIPFFGQFLMFFAPVVFAMPTSGLSKILFEINFMTPLLITGRDLLTGGSLEWLFYFGCVNSLAIFTLIAAWVIYRVTMPILIERMSS